MTAAPAARTFYVGAPAPKWLTLTTVPQFVSHTRLRTRRNLPRAVARWALDSGGFTELSRHGRWTITPAAYATAVRRYRDEIGGLDWAAPQDWMCEPEQLDNTGLTVAEHQRRTVDNYLELRAIAPDLPIIPVVQGWTVGSYRRCVELYAAAGVDLRAESVVGIGSVCRRTNPVTVALIVDELRALGLSGLHGFGVKSDALALVAGQLSSADSQAWSSAARARREPCSEDSARRDCRNCMHYALEWVDQLRTAIRWHDVPTALLPAPRNAVDELTLSA
jgi:hypothetical protein